LSKVENDFRLIKNRLRMRYFLVFTICMFWMAGVHAQSPAAAKTLPAPAIKEPPQANNRPVLEVDEWWDEEEFDLTAWVGMIRNHYAILNQRMEMENPACTNKPTQLLTTSVSSK
jgi:hypothetical protein